MPLALDGQRRPRLWAWAPVCVGRENFGTALQGRFGNPIGSLTARPHGDAFVICFDPFDLGIQLCQKLFVAVILVVPRRATNEVGLGSGRTQSLEVIPELMLDFTG